MQKVIIGYIKFPKYDAISTCQGDDRLIWTAAIAILLIFKNNTVYAFKEHKYQLIYV